MEIQTYWLLLSNGCSFLFSFLSTTTCEFNKGTQNKIIKTYVSGCIFNYMTCLLKTT